jgi:peptidoglycan/xylan/chitin deacetylase (PgdA/CDA1 family)
VGRGRPTLSAPKRYGWRVIARVRHEGSRQTCDEREAWFLLLSERAQVFRVREPNTYMNRHGTNLVKAALSAAHYVGVDGLLAPLTRGAGVIFMLHHVRPEAPKAFEPNRILKVTPSFLEDVIEEVHAAGFDTVSLDEVEGRLANPGTTRPFACFTLDDGYRDNRDYAYPVFKRHNVPFTVYVPTDFADGTGFLWWLVLEEVVSRAPFVAIQMNGLMRNFSCETAAKKSVAYDEIYWWLRGLPEDRARYVVRELAQSIDYDCSSLCRDLVMNWDELREFVRDPLVTIGAHTRSHFALGKLTDAQAEAEIIESVARIERELGVACQHLSYPYGCPNSAGRREFEFARKAGMKTAVTTRKGLIASRHTRSMQALPRLSLNGDYQDARYVKVMLSGAPFAVWNAMHRG